MDREMKKAEEFQRLEAYEYLEGEYIEEIESFAIRLRHKRTGAKLIVLSNENPYKVFHISFLTPPKNSRGVAHILEHSVLAGSRKYPTGTWEKIIDGLSIGGGNALTSADHTSFYFMAQKEEEFLECMDLYMDSVFYPLVLTDENIFKREGWRLEIVEDEEGEPYIDYNGVVLNEMKAHDGNYVRRAYDKFYQKLMEGSVYHYRSGGKSYQVPKCSYEELVQYHKDYYHPSNACIYLYGDMEPGETLRFLDEEYLSCFERREPVILPMVSVEKSLEICKKKIKAEKEEDHFYIYGFLFGEKVRPEQAMAFRLFLKEMASIVRHELSGVGIFADVECGFSQTGPQDSIDILIFTEVKNAGKDIYKAVKKAIRGKFENDEVFRAELMARINCYELGFWEDMNAKGSVGVNLFEMLEKYWYYDERYVFDVFQVSDQLQYVKNRIWGGCYNTLISQEIPKQRREVLLECQPKFMGGDYFLKRLYDPLNALLKDFTDEEFLQLEKEDARYRLWDEEVHKRTGQSEEWKKTREKIREHTEMASTEYVKSVEGGITYYHIPVTQSKVVWLCLSFDADDFKEHISELNLLVNFIDGRDFGSFFGLGYDEAKTFLTSYLITELVVNRDFSSKSDLSHLRVDISTCVLEENIPDAVRLIQRMLFDIFIAIPNFEEGIERRMEQMKADFCDSPENYHTIAGGAVVDERILLMDQSGGWEYYEFLDSLKKGGRKALKSFYKNCYAMLNRIFVEERLSVFCSSSERGLILVKKSFAQNALSQVHKELLSKLKKDYKDAIREEENYEIRKELKRWKKFFCRYGENTELTKWREGTEISAEASADMSNRAVIIPSSVNYISFYGSAGEGYDYLEANVGALRVAEAMIKSEYLRNELREHGGAYGFDIAVYTSGKLEITSYRDPHLKRSFQVIKKCGVFLKNYDFDEKKLSEIKLSMLNGMLDSKNSDPWSGQEDVRSIEIKQMEPDFEQRTMEQIRDCTREDILEAAELIEQMLENGRFCVFGSKKSIEKRASLFGRIDVVFEEEGEEEEKPVQTSPSR